MGCVSSSTHKKQKKQEQKASNTQRPAKEEHNTAEIEKVETKRNHTSVDHGAQCGTEPNINIVHVKDSPYLKSQIGQHNRQPLNKEQFREFHTHRPPKNSTKETNEKTQGTGNQLLVNNQQAKLEDLGRILDEELLKELEGDRGKVVNDYNGEKDSVALDFEELKTKSQFPGSGLITNDPKDDGKGDLSLTLNLTDLRIEQHQ